MGGSHLFSLYIGNGIKKQIETQVRKAKDYFPTDKTQKVIVFPTSSKERLEFTDKELHSRIYKILRLKNAELVQFFDKEHSYLLELRSNEESKPKHLISGKLLQISPIIPLKPSITLAITLLKKEQFEEVCYLGAQMGVTNIVPLFTSKMHSKSAHIFQPEKLQRYENIFISAAEQSKQFSLPSLSSPLSFHSFLNSSFCSFNQINKNDNINNNINNKNDNINNSNLNNNKNNLNNKINNLNENTFNNDNINNNNNINKINRSKKKINTFR